MHGGVTHAGAHPRARPRPGGDVPDAGPVAAAAASASQHLFILSFPFLLLSSACMLAAMRRRPRPG
eukprot:scaffold650_cov407-Prasinococcus_capsulatus_cf.AAC.34